MNRFDGDMFAREIQRLGMPLANLLRVVSSTGSTNDDARHAALAGAPHGTTIVADTQTTGRGRDGHAWYSPPGDNIYLSVVLRPRLAARYLAPITLAFGVAISDVVVRHVAVERRAEIALKWPNDVMAKDRKLAGILVEGQLRGDVVGSLVVGVGLNVGTRCFPAELTDRATSLALLGYVQGCRETLAAELLAALLEAAAKYEVEKLAPFVDDLKRLDWLRGKLIGVGSQVGIAEGIDLEGHLLLRDKNAVLHRFASGEVSLLDLNAPHA